MFQVPKLVEQLGFLVGLVFIVGVTFLII